jgi:hypothetical protein
MARREDMKHGATIKTILVLSVVALGIYWVAAQEKPNPFEAGAPITSNSAPGYGGHRAVAVKSAIPKPTPYPTVALYTPTPAATVAPTATRTPTPSPTPSQTPVVTPTPTSTPVVTVISWLDWSMPPGPTGEATITATCEEDTVCSVSVLAAGEWSEHLGWPGRPITFKTVGRRAVGTRTSTLRVDYQFRVGPTYQTVTIQAVKLVKETP